MKTDRYHPFLVALHWTLAYLIIVDISFAIGALVHLPNDSPTKLQGLTRHAGVGIAIFALMLVRLLVRLRTTSPERAPTGHKFLDRLARLSHRLFYMLVFGMTTSGATLVLQAHVVTTGVLPASFWVYPVRYVHYVLSRLLIGLIGLHVTAVVYHMIFLKDGLLRRMTFRLPSRASVMRAIPILARTVLIAQAVVLTLIALRALVNPFGSAADAQIALGAPMAVILYEVGLGALPLAAAMFVFGCAILQSALRVGLTFIAIFDLTALLVRLYMLNALGVSLTANRGPLIGESVLGCLAIIALALSYKAPRATPLIRAEAS